LAFMCLCFFACNTSKEVETKTSTVTNPIPLKFGDPFLLHASDGRYYMYGTSLGDGFEAFVSDDLVQWDSCGQVYKAAILRSGTSTASGLRRCMNAMVSSISSIVPTTG
jgi:hypothetical protein